jgi:hypothetical protein
LGSDDATVEFIAPCRLAQTSIGVAGVVGGALRGEMNLIYLPHDGSRTA